MTTTLRSLVPSFAVDVVGVYDVNFNQVFPDGRPIKATVKEEATFFKHPLENSASRTDHIIFNPVEVSLSVILTGYQYRNVYQQIKQIFRAQTELIVQTKTDTYESMYIQGIPHDETPYSYDAVIMNLNLAETQLAATEVTFQPSNSADTDTVNRGQQEPGTPNDAQQAQGSTLSRIFS